jgi:hypothetical protein
MKSRIAQLLAVLLILQGCSTWRVQGFAPRIVIEDQKPNEVKALMRDGREIVVEHPSVEVDSLVGVSSERPISLPLDGVGQVAIKRGTFPWLPVIGGSVLAVGLVLLVGLTWD